MDVEELAPSVLALAALCKRANQLFNDDRVSMRLFIQADEEQKCFQLKLELVQSFLDTVRTLLSDDKNASTAEQIAMWLGILSTTAVATGGAINGLYRLLKFLKGKKPKAVSQSQANGQTVMQITADGGSTVLVFPQTYHLYQDQEAVKQAKRFTEPVTHDGYDFVEFEKDGLPGERITNDEARLIRDTPEPEKPVATSLPESKMRCKIRIRKAVYEGPGKWTIQHDRSREVVMADKEWLERFQTREVLAPPGSILEVDLQISAIDLDRHGDPVKEPEYTVTKVYGVEEPSPKPATFFDRG